MNESYLHGCDVVIGAAPVVPVPVHETATRWELVAIALGALASIATVMQFIMFLERRK